MESYASRDAEAQQGELGQDHVSSKCQNRTQLSLSSIFMIFMRIFIREASCCLQIPNFITTHFRKDCRQVCDVYCPFHEVWSTGQTHGDGLRIVSQPKALSSCLTHAPAWKAEDSYSSLSKIMGYQMKSHRTRQNCDNQIHECKSPLNFPCHGTVQIPKFGWGPTCRQSIITEIY